MSTLKDLLTRLSQRGHSDTVAALDLIDRKKWNERAHANWDRCVRQADTVFQSVCPGASPATADPSAATRERPGSDEDEVMGDKIFVNNGLMLSEESTQALFRAMAAEETNSNQSTPAAVRPDPPDRPNDSHLQSTASSLQPILWPLAKKLFPLLITAGITLAIAKTLFVDTNSTYDAQALEYIPEGSIDVP